MVINKFHSLGYPHASPGKEPNLALLLPTDTMAWKWSGRNILSDNLDFPVLLYTSEA